MSVAKYEKKYIELSKYAIGIIEDETEKCRRFEEGMQKVRGRCKRKLLILSVQSTNSIDQLRYLGGHTLHVRGGSLLEQLLALLDLNNKLYQALHHVLQRH